MKINEYLEYKYKQIFSKILMHSIINSWNAISYKNQSYDSFKF